jgi:hypothetical protein
MGQHSLPSNRWLAVGTLAVGAMLLLAVPAPLGRAQRAAAAFPDGFWCGIGKAPAGEVVPAPVKGAIGKGILYFALSRGKGGVDGYGTALFTAHLEKATGESVSVSNLIADGTFDEAIGTPAAPALVGSWKISGEVKVIQPAGTFTHPLSFQSKNWKGKLVVEKATPNVVTGHWIVPKWKWTAKRLGKKASCLGASK